MSDAETKDLNQVRQKETTIESFDDFKNRIISGF